MNAPTEPEPITDEQEIAAVDHAVAEIERAIARMREAIRAGRYVEAQGWGFSIRDAYVEQLDGALGGLAGGERNRVLDPEGSER